MKKIMLLLLLLNFSKIIVSAETIYGEYYKINSINEYIEDEIKIESYNVYNTYRLEYEDMGYIEDNDLYIKDMNDYKTIKYDYNVLVNTSSKYGSIDTLIIGDLNIHFKIYELEIYNKDQRINYSINNIDKYYEHETAYNIFDNDYNTYYLNKRAPEKMHINLNGNYNLKDLKIVLYSGSEKIVTNLRIYIDNEPFIDFPEYNNYHSIKFNVDDDNIGSIEYLYDGKILYKHYKENKIIENIYVIEGDNLILDDYKIVEEYYKRDKLVLKDSLIIDNKYMNIYDLIEYSSNEVITECNINYEINGLYKCKFILNDINIEKDIIVDIKKDKEIEVPTYNNTVIEKKTEKAESITEEPINNKNSISVELENKNQLDNKEIIDKNNNDNINSINDISKEIIIEEKNIIEKSKNNVKKEIKKSINQKKQEEEKPKNDDIKKLLNENNESAIKSNLKKDTQKEEFISSKIKFIMAMVIFLISIILLFLKKKKR